MLDEEKPTDAPPEDWSSLEWTEGLQSGGRLSHLGAGCRGEPDGAFDLRRACAHFR